jgi:phytanoyl-CoA hydroxylase
MLELKTPRGLPVNVPEFIDEDSSERFSLNDLANAKLYYDENGYVIFEKIISHQICDKLRHLWNTEIKPYNGFIYRQATARAEKHIKNANDWIMNPILNLQSLNPSSFPNFRKFSVESVFNNQSLAECFKNLLNETPKIVQSMYFEGNSATWEHQDSYYLDSENIGEMAGAWIALEDIVAKAGRFFICPRSNLIQLQKHGLKNNIAQNHEAYIKSVVDEIKDKNL